MPTNIALFTRDLRIHDNPVLAGAAAGGAAVVPLFLLDDKVLKQVGPGRRRFLAEALADLDAALRKLGTPLVLRSGETVAEVARLAAEVAAAEVHIARDVSGFAANRERRLAEALRGQGIRLRAHDRVHTVQAPGDLRPADRDHFSVFTPYWRRWAEAPLRAPATTPRRLTGPAVPGLPLPEPGPGPEVWTMPGGETAGRARARRWLAETVADYPDIHDDLAADATSRLSPYLHFGCVSATELAARAGHDHPGPGSEAFLRQLCWRDFHHQVLAARPDAATVDLRPRDGGWTDDPDAFAAWCAGRTGVPIVDAGMRQLLAEGWMHNRARLVTAGFLTKTLRIDWRLGAAHFAALLLDADVANNNLNWQWSAGTGLDTRPNRVLNPLRQAARYDPAGEYVRRYVPELAGVAEAGDVQQPWRLAGAELRGLGYPAPIVGVEGGRVTARSGAEAEPLF